MRKRIFISLVSAMATVLLCLGLSACAGTNGKSGDSANQQVVSKEGAMKVISAGLEKRWAINDQYDSATDQDAVVEGLKKSIQAEIDNDSQLKSAKFDDSKLQETVLSYLNCLDDSLKVIKEHGYDTQEYDEAWTEVYNKRSAILKTMKDDYGLTVSKDYESTLDELVANGNDVQEYDKAEKAINGLFANVQFEQTDDGYGNYTYSATVKNTSDLSFENISLVLGLYDSNGVRQGESYVSTNTWAAGETVKFEGYGTINAAQIKVEINYYEVAK